MNLEEAKTKKTQQILEELATSKEGLSKQSVTERQEKIGLNKIPEKKDPLFLKILKYFWGPIPLMIECAAILTAILEQWKDFYIILILLLVNSLVRFYEEFQAGNAIKALKKNLALKSLVKREGKWQEVQAEQLVPGDIVSIKLGTIVPADGKLIEGEYVSIDQSTLTGESLPITKKPEDIVYSGSIVKKGKMVMVVLATGLRTFFGKTIHLVAKAKSVSHFQKAILTIGNFLIIISFSLAILLIVVQLFRATPFLEILQYILLLIIASIPVALPAVLSVTMAIGALTLSRMKVIVARLESIEEMAGVEVLCCDKTGTLTQNKLTLGQPITIGDNKESDVVFYGALASEKEGLDSIDAAIVHGVREAQKLNSFKQISFVPFDPVNKKTEAEIEDPQGNKFFVTKGAFQVIAALCHLDADAEKKMTLVNEELGKKGNRTLAVAKSVDKKKWEFIGLLPLYDPLREDAAETIKEAEEHGLQIKMLTGDNVAIAREIAKELHLDQKLSIAEDVFKKGMQISKEEMEEQIEKTTAFCQVFPEHKYTIIQNLQSRNYIVGMTGDGVNDAPALKQADVGIAVSGATDAAREASALILLESGIKTIIKGIEESRRIFERMKSYAIYRITETIRVILFITASILFLNFYPITPLMIILLALLNDLPIMTIAFDHTLQSKSPVRWKMKDILCIASILGGIGIISSFSLLLIAKYWFQFPTPQLQSLIFLKLSFAGHLTLFVARTRGAFFKKPYPSPLLFFAILGTQLVALALVGFGFLLSQVPWKYIILLYGYALSWLFVMDGCKLLTYKVLFKNQSSPS